MPVLSYRQAGLILKAAGGGASERQIRDLQRDLRRLGYLKSGIDGNFAGVTGRAVKALQYDLLHNDGSSGGGDGKAALRLLDFNRGRVTGLSGEADQGLVDCISDLLDAGAPMLPFSRNPVEENREVVAAIQALPPAEAPIPFLLAILKQESGLKHYHEPGPGDEDTFITTGFDTNAGENYIIKSRGYGAGQYTLFHHPPRAEEVGDFMLDVGRNVQKAGGELRERFDRFVNGPSPGTRADDRQAELRTGPPLACKYGPEDPRYLKDCRQCAREAGLQDIRAGVTPLYPGSDELYQPTPRYPNASHQGVPARRGLGCDWPYAARRYNGAGMDSYHYQARVLQNLLAL